MSLSEFVRNVKKLKAYLSCLLRDVVAIGFGLALLLPQLEPDGLMEVLGLGLASETLLVPLSLLFLVGQLACTACPW